ncbi:MAG: PA0069 family radical SAM protein [Deltaproteobacteria bacterium]|jgi:DNA repair photolyase
MPTPLANPPNPWSSTHIDHAGEHLDAPPPLARLEVREEHAKSILARNDSPDLSFRWSLNPYRGCYHGCAYCYARPSHQYWGFGAGTDFDRKLVVKVNTVELLEAALAAPSWRGEWIVLSGNTDCYQPLEASYRLTRRVLETCLRYRQPLGVITKSSLVRRDLDVLADLARRAQLKVTVSAAMPDDELGRALEPFASPISKRFEAMRALADAGVSVGISLAPIIPGVNDDAIPRMLSRARDHGASFAFMSMVRLSREVLPVFDERLEAALPLRAEKVRAGIRAMREGEMNDARFGNRMRGEGERWRLVEQLFRMHVERLGLARSEEVVGEEARTFERPGRQLALF